MAVITRIQANGFMSYRTRQVVSLPESGIVLISGENGSGKSSLIEAISVGLWGKTLRGHRPWRKDMEGECVVSTDRVTVTRKHKNTNSLEWQEVGSKSVFRYETLTKTQTALEVLLGSWDVWRRTHVFSSQDAAHFTMSTDSERKRLLETILSINRFDEALEKCKFEYKSLQADFRTIDSHYEWLDGVCAGVAGQIAKLTTNLEILEKDKLDQTPIHNYNLQLYVMLLGIYQEKLENENQELLKFANLTGQQVAECKTLQRQLQGLQADHCYACGQALDTSKRTELQTRVNELRQEIEAISKQTSTQVAKISERRQILTTKIKEISQIKSLETEKCGYATSAHNAYLRSSSELQQAQATYKQHKVEKSAVYLSRKQLGNRIDTLDAVMVALGLKGVRSALLGTALSGVERIANLWLNRVSHRPVSIRLEPTTEKKSGGVSDTISLRIQGFEEDEYEALSGGERRRVDVALMLALAEVSSGLEGRTTGTLFFDELFDGLDMVGTQMVVECLQELSKNRCVVVISHSEALATHLRPKMRLVVCNGVINE